MFIDTHVHFDGMEDVDGVIERAVAAGIVKMVAVGGSQRGNAMAVELVRKHPDRIIATAGFDREHAGKTIDFAAFESFARDSQVCAIGEVGLDYHYHPETALAQKELLSQMLEIAERLDLPVVIHSREADADTIELLGRKKRIKGVIHCFTGNRSFAEKLVGLGLYINFSGILTFRNAVQIREAAKVVPDDRLLIETDSPYLAPEPHRGKKNEPAYVRHVAEVLASVRGCQVEKIAEITAANAVRLFGLKR